MGSECSVGTEPQFGKMEGSGDDGGAAAEQVNVPNAPELYT